MTASLKQKKQEDEEFFRSVLAEPFFKKVLDDLSLDKHYAKQSQHNAVLVLTKRGWTLETGEIKKLEVHFEARNRRELRLEVGLREYEGHIEEKPVFGQIQKTLNWKGLLIAELREKCPSLCSWPQSINPSVNRLLDQFNPRSHTAVKFSGVVVQEPSSRESATFFADVISRLQNAVDAVVESFLEKQNSKVGA